MPCCVTPVLCDASVVWRQCCVTPVLCDVIARHGTTQKHCSCKLTLKDWVSSSTRTSAVYNCLYIMHICLCIIICMYITYVPKPNSFARFHDREESLFSSLCFVACCVTLSRTKQLPLLVRKTKSYFFFVLNLGLSLPPMNSELIRVLDFSQVNFNL
jgi:hypothetical protein